MPDQYTIYLVNESSSTQLFWCFLERPEELVSDPNVFANSSTSLQIGSNQPGLNSFTIPVQYVVGAGASNNAIAPNIQINATVKNDANLKDKWETTYANVPPNQGPIMKKIDASSPANTIAMKSSPFEKAKNEALGWYSSMMFGIQTKQGFIGMTWAPDPHQTRTLTPKLAFYVTVGTYGSNILADFTTVANDSAEILVPSSFDAANNTTVTYTTSGTWKVTPGKPSVQALAASNFSSSLIQSHLYLSKAHSNLVCLAQLSNNDTSLQLLGMEQLEGGTCACNEDTGEITRNKCDKGYVPKAVQDQAGKYFCECHKR